MRYYLDTEFIERGSQFPIQLVSIGIVSQDGREYYAISSEFDPETASPWVMENVIKKLEPSEIVKRRPLNYVASEVANFIHYVPPKMLWTKPQFYGYYSDYDWVVFCQLFGTMMDLPNRFPRYCNDIKQIAYELGDPELPEMGKGEHNALADARWNKIAHEFLMGLKL